MNDRAEAVHAPSVGGSRAYWSLLALVAGLALGAIVQRSGDGLREPALQLTTFVGELWLDALKMTVIPLIVALLFTGIVSGTEAARAGKVAGRTLIWVVIIYAFSAILGAVAMPFLLDLFPLPAVAADALRMGLQSLDPAAASAPVPAASDFFRNIIPSNVVSAAVNNEVLSIVVFTLFLALATTRLPSPQGQVLAQFFKALGDALLIVIGWVLRVAPIGILALAFTLGASAGGSAFAGLIHYIVLVSAIGLCVMLLAYLLAIFVAGINPIQFAKAMIAPQTVAISTRSSLASLPAMLGSARLLGIREQVADVTLPLAVALFRATGPAMNLGVAFYTAYWLGLEPGIGQIIAATAVAAVISFGAVSLPGEISFVTSIAPIAIALGIPVAPLVLLVAVEMVPDIFRTVGNVTMDVTIAGIVDRRSAKPDPAASAEAVD